MTPALANKLLEWERRRDKGTPITPEELCADWPEGLEEVRRQIHRLLACNQLLGFEFDPDATDGWCHDSPDVLPTRIAGFQIRGLLGFGGMADVYDGWDPVLHRAVAVKVLRSTAHGAQGFETELADRFSREGAVLARLDHDHIVRVYQAGVWEGRPYLAMARIGGGPLSDRVADLCNEKPRRVAELVEKVACGVQAAHDQGVLHRDLKPANILVDSNGEPRVSDFGLAKWWTNGPQTADEKGPGPSRALNETFSEGSQPGTPTYMAPEQFEPTRGPVGPATDVWALGIILHELLTGRRPFAGESRRELGTQICEAPTPSCRAVRREVPRWLDRIVTRCLQKSANDRFASPADLAAALRTGLRRRRKLGWLAGTVGVLCLALTVGLFGGRYVWGGAGTQSDEVRFEDSPAVVNALATLDRGPGEVSLVNDSEMASFRPLFGNETVRALKKGTGPLSLDSRWPGASAVEFLPGLPTGDLRVTARLEHVSGGDHSKIALFVGGRSWESERGRHLSCVALQFLDAGSIAAEPPENGKSTNAIASLRFLLVGDDRTQPNNWVGFERGKLNYLSAAAAGRPAIRQLSLTLAGDQVHAEWDGKPVGRVTRPMVIDALMQFLLMYPERVPRELPSDPFHGSIGLIIYNGTVNVHEFRIERLK